MRTTIFLIAAILLCLPKLGLSQTKQQIQKFKVVKYSDTANLGSATYTEHASFTLGQDLGNHITFRGFYDGDPFVAYSVENMTTISEREAPFFRLIKVHLRDSANGGKEFDIYISYSINDGKASAKLLIESILYYADFTVEDI